MEKITFSEFNKWAETHSNSLIKEMAFFDEEDAFEDLGVQYHKGDITLDSLSISPCVVIDGNLTINENFSWQYERGLLVVNGNLDCNKFDFPFQTVVTGNLTCQTIDVNSLYDYQMDIGGDIIADIIIERGHSIVVKGEIKAGKVYGSHIIEDKNGFYTNLSDWDELPEDEQENEEQPTALTEADNYNNANASIEDMVLEYRLGGCSEESIFKEAEQIYTFSGIELSSKTLVHISQIMDDVRKPSVAEIEENIFDFLKIMNEPLTEMLPQKSVWQMITESSSLARIDNKEINKAALEERLRQQVEKWYKK